jgi:hypothetical protein
VKSLFLVASGAIGLATFAAPPAEPPPVQVSITVAPEPAAPGSDAAVTVVLKPGAGIKLNKYPKIKLQVPAAPGVVAEASGAIGTSGPPPADQLESNYYKGGVDPLVVHLAVDPAAAPGKHDVPGKLSYFYCVAASGYCAPAKVDVSIPITVR